jgi:hypothetical protein
VQSVSAPLYLVCGRMMFFLTASYMTFTIITNILLYEKEDDTKGIMKIIKSKEDQCHGQKNADNKTINETHNTTQKAKD